MGVDDVVGSSKPSRSESGDGLTEEEQAKHAQQLKEFFETRTPHRALKPGRSELQDSGDFEVPVDACKAEILRFQELEVNDEPLHTEGGIVNDETYVETPYYDDLNAVDKSLHHETGTGFISNTEGGKLSFSLAEDGQHVFHASTKTNPATNEWDPAPTENISIEAKVHRSDL